MFAAAIGFGVAVFVSILFPEAWASIVVGGRRVLMVVERVKVSIERIKE